MLPVLAALVAALVSSANGQTTHTVTVGLKGSFYDPPTINALVNDTIQFLFSGIFHGVTQSTFENPCSPMPGGFSSGLAGTVGNTSIGPPVWNLVVTNVSAPIYFFCEATQPESHCESGMVGAINAEPAMYTSFQAAAKLVTGTPMPTPTVILQGVGAFATASPSTPLLTSTTAASSSTGSASVSTVTASASSTPSSSSSKSGVSGAVLGGAIGGGVALVVIGILVGLLLRSKRQRKDARRREENIISAMRAYGGGDRHAGDRSSFPGPGTKAGYVSPDPSDADSLGYNRIARGDAYYTTAGALPQMTNTGFGAPASYRDRERERDDDRDLRGGIRNQNSRGRVPTARAVDDPRRPGNGNGNGNGGESVSDINETAMASLARNPTYSDGVISSASGTVLSNSIAHPYNAEAYAASGRPTTSDSQSSISQGRSGVLAYSGMRPAVQEEDMDEDMMMMNVGPHAHAAAPRYADAVPPPHGQQNNGNTANVHEIAKEVAALLGPRLRSPPPPQQPPPPLAALGGEMPEQPGASMSGAGMFGSVAGRQRRELPTPHRFSPSSVPPEYES